MAIITTRLWTKVTEKKLLSGINYGYSKEVSANMGTATLKLVVDDAAGKNHSLLVPKLDAKRAFDSGPPEAITAALGRIGCPQVLVKIIGEMYQFRTVAVMTAMA